MTNWTDKLRSMGARDNELAWFIECPSWADAWRECPRAGWLLWLLGETGADHVEIARCACEIAGAVLHLVPPDEEFPRRALESAKAWCDDPEPVGPDVWLDAENGWSTAALRAWDPSTCAAAACAAAWAACVARGWASAACDAAEWAAKAAPGAASRHAGIVRRRFDCPHLEV